MKRLIKHGVLVDAQGEYRQDLLIEDGVIRARATDIQSDGETELIDASGCYVMPGGIDVHTHFNIDVGIARSCDDFFSGTRAAACGGTTTIVDHMGFGPAGCNLHHQLARYHDYAATQAVVDYSFHGVVQHVDDAILHEMAAMVQEEGISSFKLYLTYQYKLGDHDVLRALARLKEVGALATVHPENDAAIAVRRAALLAAGPTRRVWVKISGAYRNGNGGRGEAVAKAAMPRLKDALGLDRLVWGSDWPHTQFESQISYDRMWAFAGVLLPDAAERKQVLVDTPAQLFRFA